MVNYGKTGDCNMIVMMTYSVIIQSMNQKQISQINSLKPSNVVEIFVDTGSGNGLVTHGTKPLPKPKLTNHQWWSSGILTISQ